MAESIASDLAVKLLESLGELAVQKLAPYFGGQSKLNELQLTMELIQAKLHDAERRGEGEDSSLVKQWLKSLKRLLYKLDDLFEDVSVAFKEREYIIHAGRLSNPVRYGKNKSDHLKLNKKVSQEFEAIMREIEAIKSVMGGLNLRDYSIEEQRALNFISTRVTHSFVTDEEVIGRRTDRDAIVEMLSTSQHGKENVSVIPIVGMGGLGKTTLAQLVYNDENVRFELKIWVCISDSVDVEEQARKILKCIPDDKCGDKSGDNYDAMRMEQLQSRLRGALSDKKYLLVLDDVWDDDYGRWLDLKRLLSGGKQGSKILVTTRSIKVAEMMGTVKAHTLEGLSEDDSWALFESIAFRDGVAVRNQNLVSIGKEIVKKCANVPLALRTTAGLLRSKHTEQEWLYMKDYELRRIQHNENGSNAIMSTLKLSYDHLPSQLKPCFAYCSLFPKDHEFDKESLIRLWMAQGYIRPLGNESLEAAGDEYFMELLSRGFFQDVIRNKCGRIKRCKMHDLMNDLACEVGDECLLVLADGSLEKINDDTRHVSLFIENFRASSSSLLSSKHKRSLFCRDFHYADTYYMKTFLSRWEYLRALEFRGPLISVTCNSIGELKHLRYLKLVGSDICVPDGITRLHNLQTLDLCEMSFLEKLPRGLSEMMSLRHLRIGSEFRLKDLPPSFGELNSLRTLDCFVVGGNNGLDALANLDISGKLCIRFSKYRQKAKAEAKKASLKGKKLTSLKLYWKPWSKHEVLALGDEEEVLECLEPPPTLENLSICFWKGVKLPTWMRMDESAFPNLVSVEIKGCERCLSLPPLNRLPRLRHLKLEYLDALEYIEHGDEGGDRSEASSTYFPSLEYLELSYLQELKGWSSSRVGDDTVGSGYLHIPRLSKLEIKCCPKLMDMPRVPRVGELIVYHIPDKLLEQLLKNREEPTSASSSSSINTTLERLTIGWSPRLTALPDSIGNLTHLRHLYIWGCHELRSFPESFRNLTALQTLRISGCPESFPDSLIRDLTALQTLDIEECPNLEQVLSKTSIEVF